MEEYWKFLLQVEDSAPQDKKIIMAGCRFDTLGIVTEFEHFKDIQTSKTE